jgi:hypothetical protein
VAIQDRWVSDVWGHPSIPGHCSGPSIYPGGAKLGLIGEICPKESMDVTFVRCYASDGKAAFGDGCNHCAVHHCAVPSVYRGESKLGRMGEICQKEGSDLTFFRCFAS